VVVKGLYLFCLGVQTVQLHKYINVAIVDIFFEIHLLSGISWRGKLVHESRIIFTLTGVFQLQTIR